MYNKLAEFTALKKTVTTISTENMELQQSLENTRQKAKLVGVLTAQKQESDTEIAGLCNSFTETQSDNRKLKLLLQHV
jgi:hypothetical protein